MGQVESRPLRYFVAVAEELHFGRAAERLGIAQPPLSRAIRQLETRLGVRLLERSTRAVALTPAGETLLEHARIALDALDAAARRAQRAGRPQQRLVVALKADNDGGLLPKILAAYEREQTAVPVEVLLCGWGQQAQALRDGRADVALTYQPFDERGLDSEVLLREPGVAVLPAGHPLASRTSLRLADLEHQRLPNWNGNAAHADPPNGAARHTDGDRPAVEDLAQLFKLVELGRLTAILPASVATRYPRTQLAFRLVPDAQPAVLAIAWPKTSRSLAVAAFVRAATAAATAHRPHDTTHVPATPS